MGKFSECSPLKKGWRMTKCPWNGEEGNIVSLLASTKKGFVLSRVSWVTDKDARKLTGQLWVKSDLLIPLWSPRRVNWDGQWYWGGKRKLRFMGNMRCQMSAVAWQIIMNILVLPNIFLRGRMWKGISAGAKEQLHKKTQKLPPTSAALQASMGVLCRSVQGQASC